MRQRLRSGKTFLGPTWIPANFAGFACRLRPPPALREAVVLRITACKKGTECNAQAPEALEAGLWSYFY